jgi:hypothetical protein
MDPGDKYDNYKWDFPEHDLTTIFIEGYPYKVNHDNSNARAQRLHNIRKYIDNLCQNILYSNSDFGNDDDFSNGMLVFLDTHCELTRPRNDSIYHTSLFNKRLNGWKTSSRYLLSEIPKSVKTDLIGINKPKMRYIDSNAKSIGRDKQLRAAYRDIFIKEDLSDDEVINLLLHELAHSGACHFTWVDDNHKKDFKKVEKFLKNYAP